MYKLNSIQSREYADLIVSALTSAGNIFVSQKRFSRPSFYCPYCTFKHSNWIASLSQSITNSLGFRPKYICVRIISFAPHKLPYWYCH